MKFFICLLSILVALTSFTFFKKELVSTLSYDPDLVHISKVDYKNEDYYVIYMKTQQKNPLNICYNTFFIFIRRLGNQSSMTLSL